MKTEFKDFYFSAFDMEVRTPNKHFVFDKLVVDTRSSKWEKIRNDLIWKMKKGRSFINKIVLIILTVAASIMTTCICLAIVSLFESGIIAIEMGIFTPLTWVFCYVFLSSYIETDPNFIKIKRRNKTY